jgi:proliferating cell nuclear antigen
MEAELADGLLLRKVLEALRELVGDATLRWSATGGLTIQEMDSSHVALMSLRMPPAAFARLNVPKPVSMGLTVEVLRNRLRCCRNNNGSITFWAPDDVDERKTLKIQLDDKHGRISVFDMTLMDIESDQLGIPDTPSDAIAVLSSAEYQRIMRELKEFGDTVEISVSSERLRFAIAGSSVSGSIIFKPTPARLSKPLAANSRLSAVSSKPDRPRPGGPETAVRLAPSVDSKTGRAVAFIAPAGGARAKAAARKAEAIERLANGEQADLLALPADDKGADRVEITMRPGIAECSHNFALRYLEKFGKAAALATTVRLRITRDMPLVVEYLLPAGGCLAFYLAPKLADDAPDHKAPK